MQALKSRTSNLCTGVLLITKITLEFQLASWFVVNLEFKALTDTVCLFVSFNRGSSTFFLIWITSRDVVSSISLLMSTILCRVPHWCKFWILQILYNLFLCLTGVSNKYLSKLRIYNFQWDILHSIVERSKEILPNKVYGSKLEKKESTRNSVETKKQITVIPQIVSTETILVHSIYRCRNY